MLFYRKRSGLASVRQYWNKKLEQNQMYKCAKEKYFKLRNSMHKGSKVEICFKIIK